MTFYKKSNNLDKKCFEKDIKQIDSIEIFQ